MPTENAVPVIPPAADDQAPVVETPAAPSEAERMEAVFAAGTEAAAQIEGAEPAPPVEGEPEVAEDPAPAVEEPAPVVAEEAPPAEPAVPLTDEEQDAADAKALGFKNQKANTEFKSMRAELRELRPLKEQLEQYKQPAESWQQVEGFLKSYEISPTQFKQGMTMMAGLNSSDLTVLRGVRDGLAAELATINKRLGESGHGYDPLSEPGNQDLQRAVQDEQITPQHAAELAKTRREAAHYQQLNQQTVQRQQQSEAQQNAIVRGRQEVDSVLAEYKQIDPQFEAKIAVLEPTIVPILNRMQPSEWASALKDAYRNLPATAAAPAPAARPAAAPLRNQPLRAAAMPPGGPAAVAKSPEDIMEQAIAAAAAQDGVAYRVSGA